MKNIQDKTKSIQENLVQIRRELHMCPEVAEHEEKTAEVLKKHLREIGVPFEENVGGGYGIVGTIEGKKPGKTVALRADMDALAILEKFESDFKSKNEGKMHACGHDSHMTMLLGATRVLYENRDELEGTVKVVFQPAEEFSPNGGAPKIIASGILDDVDAIFALHVWPDLPFGQVGILDDAMMANSDHFQVRFFGKSSHAARPNEGVDAVIMGVQFVSSLQPLISRETNPMDSAVITVSQFHAGHQYNVMADEAFIDGTCRTFSFDDRDRIEAAMKNLAEGIAKSYRGKADVNYMRGYPAVINTPELAELVRQSVKEEFGEKAIYPLRRPSMTGEDFSFYLQKKPGAFMWLGIGKDDGSTYPLHNPMFNLDEDILWRGSAILVRTAINFLNK